MNNTDIPRPEYPRPDFERAEWLNLNGEWDFEFDDLDTGESDGWYRNSSFSRKITVPFCFQSSRSGINDQGMHQIFWYKKDFFLPDYFTGKRGLLNFGAVDYLAKVWVNGEYAGGHQGGYGSFKIDSTRFLKKGMNTIAVRVEDRYDCGQPRGKQCWFGKPNRCWYTPISGIWQTVWLETVGDVYIDQLHITPDIDRREVSAEVVLDQFSEALSINVSISFKGRSVKQVQASLENKISQLLFHLKEPDDIDELDYWTPETPNLYDIEFQLLKNGRPVDRVKSYFGMRKISVKGDMILLNNKPYYQKLVLDQGYWPDSLITPPSDEAIVYDIKMTKDLGFNGVRKHQKIEDPRYYYWADQLGLLVWGEMPSAYHFHSLTIENMIMEWLEFIKRDYNHPCIITWVPLNESWGVRNIKVNQEQQSYARSLYYLTKAVDTTRLISTNDGWEQVDSDICGIHDYEPNSLQFLEKYSNKEKLLSGAAEQRVLFCEGYEYQGQPIIVTEYGGIAFVSESSDNWGYYGTVKNSEEFIQRFSSVTKAIQNTRYICGYCYTQLTDVQQEINGLMDAQRNLKVPMAQIQKINSPE
ncbi:MAG TPA: glycoside hydrolase family 2 [Firmicutes bacterium]|jgi:beta-galactosidase/beta-glucuronidase|nr:glycoside hydrolase family 2 [Bacillota bacterium]